MCVGFSCTLHYWCSFVQGFVCIDCIGCVCEERVYKLCMCLFVCVLSLYMFVCASECTTVHIGKRHAARYGRL